MTESEPLIPKHGGYRKLKSFQIAQLRQRGLEMWDRTDLRRQELIDRRCASATDVAVWVREVHVRQEPSGRGGPSGRCGQASPAARSTSSTLSISSTYPALAANAALVLIAVACSLLDRQLAAQSKAFERDGGFTERLYQRRQRTRKRP